MRFIGLSCRKGTSTVLGTIIFIGIMFTAVIPMFLFMRQADTLHEMRKYELNRLDEEWASEDVHVYIFNKTTSPDYLTLRVENWGDFSINIARIWINDTYHILDDFNVQPTHWHEEELTGFTAVPDTRYFIKVVTDRGNVFFTDSGSIYCDEFGNLDAGMFTIFFIISYPAAGWYDVEVRYSNDNFDIFGLVSEEEFSIHKSSVGSAFDFFNVPNAQKYHVKITRGGSEVIYNNFVNIRWPNGPQSETIRI